METKEYTTIDRTGWPSGEWDGEPDKVQWQDAATGLPCLSVRHPHSGHWCGYVGVVEGHPSFGKGWEDADLTAHGGITFGSLCNPKETADRGVCHIPGVGEPDHVWWLGFDCAHAGDFGPRDAMYARDRGHPFTRNSDDKYRTLAYVKNECTELAKQLAAQV